MLASPLEPELALASDFGGGVVVDIALPLPSFAFPFAVAAAAALRAPKLGPCATYLFCCVCPEVGRGGRLGCAGGRWGRLLLFCGRSFAGPFGARAPLAGPDGRELYLGYDCWP